MKHGVEGSHHPEGDNSGTEIATRDLARRKCSRGPPLADARVKTGPAPREEARPGLCAPAAPAGPQLGTRGRAAAARGQTPGYGGRGAYKGGRSRAAPNNPLSISEGENTVREFSVFDK